MINSRLPKYSSLQQRLDHNSRVDPKSGCRLWTRALNPAGYGIIRVEDKAMLAHRVAWSAKHGPIPPGFSVCHRCDVRNCINPDHLFLGTHKENMVDMKTKM